MKARSRNRNLFFQGGVFAEGKEMRYILSKSVSKAFIIGKDHTRMCYVEVSLEHIEGFVKNDEGA